MKSKKEKVIFFGIKHVSQEVLAEKKSLKD